MRSFSKTFITGLAAILPLLGTGYLLYWLATSAESLLGFWLRAVLPVELYQPGMGLAVGILLVFFMGLLMHAWVVQRIFNWGEGLVYRIPLVKSIYGPLRDLFNFLSKPANSGFNQVVAVGLGDTEMELIGFITRKDLQELGHQPDTDNSSVAVYLPMSYMIGGYTVLVPINRIRPLAISMDEAMRFVLTGGITTHKHNNGDEKPFPEGP